MKKLEYKVSESSSGIKLGDFLRKAGLSVTLIKKAKFGNIYVDGEPATVRRILTDGETVTVVLPEEKSEGILPIDIPLNIAYEDEYVLVVDKPTNMPTHPSKGNSLPTLANAVMAKHGGDFVFRAITRLDRDTSGLVLIAKDRISAAKLSEAMKAGRFFKRYIALVEGMPNPKSGIINAPIRREQADSIKRIVAPDGKNAITEYKVTKLIGENALCDIILHTGRTHQIRVHFSHIGHPLLGDFLYGKKSDNGYFLRCCEMIFPHPITEETISINVQKEE